MTGANGTKGQIAEKKNAEREQHTQQVQCKKCGWVQGQTRTRHYDLPADQVEEEINFAPQAVKSLWYA